MILIYGYFKTCSYSLGLDDTQVACPVFALDGTGLKALSPNLCGCVPADARHALCLCGSVQEEPRPGLRAARHNEQLRVKDAAAQKTNKQEHHRTCSP